MHGRVELPELLDAPVAATHQLVVRELDLQVADRPDVTAGGERLAFASPDDGAHLGVRSQLGEDVEELSVHLVVERVVLLGVVVRDDGDRAVDLEPDRSRRCQPCRGKVSRVLDAVVVSST